MSKEGDSCILCGVGRYERFLEEFVIEDKDGHEVRVPQVIVFKCAVCADKVVPTASRNYVAKRVAEASEQLSPAEVRTLFDAMGRTQTAISEDLGFGTKTGSRWISGGQHPSKALGFYLRVMAEFPQVYEWVAKRAWKKQSAVYNLDLNPGAGGLALNGYTFRDLDPQTRLSTAPWSRLKDQNFAEQFRRTSFELAGTAR